MNRIIAVTAIIFSVFALYADDIIVLNTGDIIRASVLEIGTSEIKYKKSSNINGPTYTILKNDVLSIIYDNGDKDSFENTHEAPKADIVPANKSSELSTTKAIEGNSPSSPLQIEELEPIADDNNWQVIHKFDIGLPQRNNKHSNSVTSDAYVYFEVNETSIMSTPEAEIGIKKLTDKEYKKNPYALESLSLYPYAIIVYNKTYKPIYIDLGNTFRTEQIEDQTPTATPWLEGRYSSDNNVLLSPGVVAASLGINGAEGGKTPPDKSMQRIITVAPHSSALLPAHPYLDGEKVKDRYEYFDFTIGGKAKNRYKLKKWEMREYDGPKDAPIKVAYYVTISTDPSFSKYYTMPIHLYSKALYGRSSLETITQSKYGIENVANFLFGDLHFE